MRHAQRSATWLLRGFATGFALLTVAAFSPGQEPQVDGKTIYQDACAYCHGESGEGTDEYDMALEGTLSVAQLAQLIAETMPADDPGCLEQDEYRAIAAYMHEAFYSPVAVARNRPPRIELARLTVRQYRRAVADLVGSFQAPVKWTNQPGLKADYFAGRRMGKPVITRVDSRIDFDFGTKAPTPEIVEPREFSIRWRGAVWADDSGVHDFVLRTEHAARLWVNDMAVPLIDAWVKSGDETEYRASLPLLAGRAYSIRVDFTKAKQGVDDSDKQKEKPQSAPASIALLWQPPRGVLEPVPARRLSTDTVPKQFVCQTPFPPDDRSWGWERGTSVSKAWDRATTDAALETASYVAAHLELLAGARPGVPDREHRLRTFALRFVEPALRRPISNEEKAALVDRAFANADDPNEAVKYVVVRALKSPLFLFRELGEAPADLHTAARLAFGLWDSLPDETLRQVAARGELHTPDQIRRQATRMLSDHRASEKLLDFLLNWLNVAQEKDLGKDEQAFPDFDEAAVSDLRVSLRLGLEDLLRREDADFRRLLLSNEVYVNRRLAALYGTAPVSGTGFEKRPLHEQTGGGILTHPYLMASLAHTRESSPIHRGVFLVRGVMGQALRPPPVAIAPLAADLHPNLTTRQRVTMQTKPAACMTCHQIINPLGFTLEHFDAVGRYRDREHGSPVDALGSYRAEDGGEIALDGAPALARFVADSEEARRAFVAAMFHHLIQQPLTAYGANARDTLCETFVENECNIRALAVEIMVISAPASRSDRSVASR